MFNLPKGYAEVKNSLLVRSEIFGGGFMHAPVGTQSPADHTCAMVN